MPKMDKKAPVRRDGEAMDNRLWSTDSRLTYRRIGTLHTSTPRTTVLQWKRLMARHWRRNRISGPDGLAVFRSCIVWILLPSASRKCWHCDADPVCKLWSIHFRVSYEGSEAVVGKLLKVAASTQRCSRRGEEHSSVVAHSVVFHLEHGYPAGPTSAPLFVGLRIKNLCIWFLFTKIIYTNFWYGQTSGDPKTRALTLGHQDNRHHKRKWKYKEMVFTFRKVWA